MAMKTSRNTPADMIAGNKAGSEVCRIVITVVLMAVERPGGHDARNPNSQLLHRRIVGQMNRERKSLLVVEAFGVEEARVQLVDRFDPFNIREELPYERDADIP